MANGTQYSFQRIEKKYFISPAQMEALLNVMRQHMTADRYGEYAIGNIYCDTDNFRLIRASLEKPAYKEKLRIRCYGVPKAGDKVFVELKKKCGGVVYKRLLPEDQILMEVKALGACPLWLCRALSAQHIYPASFSKYGACYKEMCREANPPARMTNSKEAHRCA